MPDESLVHSKRVKAKSKASILKFTLAKYIIENLDTKSDRGSESITTQGLLFLQRLDRDLFEKLFSSIMAHQIDALKNRLASFGNTGIDSLISSKLKHAMSHAMRMAELQHKASRLLSNSTTDRQTEEYKHMTRSTDFYLTVKALYRAITQIYSCHVNQKWELETLSQTSQIAEKNKTCSCVCMDSYNTIYISYLEGLIKIWKRASNKTFYITHDTNFKKFQQIQTNQGLRSIFVSPDGNRLVAAVNSELIIYVIDSRIGIKNPEFKESLKMYGHTGAITCVIINERFIISGSLDTTVKLWTGTSNKPEVAA